MTEPIPLFGAELALNWRIGGRQRGLLRQIPSPKRERGIELARTTPPVAGIGAELARFWRTSP